MLSGINIDIEYEGTIYHVQTEDSGLSSPVVVTTVFKNGAILKTRKTSYAEIVKSKELKAVLKEMMTLQHKETIEDLKSGKLLGTEKTSAPRAITPQPEPPTAPTPKPVAASDAAKKRSNA